jgi:transposase
MSNRRFEMYEIRQVIVHMRSGQSDRQVAKSGLMGRKKAGEFRAIALKSGWLDKTQAVPDEAVIADVLAVKPCRTTDVSSVYRHRDEITAWWQKGIQGTTIHAALVRNHGFGGSYSSVRRFLQGLKKDNVQATVILDFAPGEAAQVDFGKGSDITDAKTGKVFSTWFFVMTLAWSRHQYAEIVTNQDTFTWLGCHRRAFECFGGVPAKIIIDNPKCAITKACYYDPEVQRSYGGLAEGYGFLISPCPPRDPQKKGIVESGVKYVKRSFLPLRKFRSKEDGNGQLLEWVMGTAGNRVHGTTRERPLTRFMEVEKALLKPLPDIPPELAVWCKAKLHGNCHLQVGKCYYSAPYPLVHRELWVRGTEKLMEIFNEHKLVAAHPRLRRPGTRSTMDEHLPPEAIAYKMRDPQWCLRQGEEIGSHCFIVMKKLFEDHVLDNLRAAQGVVSLAKKYGMVRLEAACLRALAFDSPKYRTVKTILEKGLDHQELEPLAHTLGGAYTGAGRFCRNGRELIH